MSVSTTADEKKDKLDETLKEMGENSEFIHKLIHEIIDPDTWGSQNWSEEFVSDLYNMDKSMTSMRVYINAYLRKHS